MVVQGPQYKNTSLFLDPLALAEVFVHSHSLSTNWSCHPHTLSHTKAPNSEVHTDSVGQCEEGLESGCGLGHCKEPQLSLEGAVEVSDALGVCEGQHVGLAAWGAQQGKHASVMDGEGIGEADEEAGTVLVVGLDQGDWTWESWAGG